MQPQLCMHVGARVGGQAPQEVQLTLGGSFPGSNRAFNSASAAMIFWASAEVPGSLALLSTSSSSTALTRSLLHREFTPARIDGGLSPFVMRFSG